MPTLNEPKLIAGNANRPLAEAITRRMSLHRGMDQGLLDARVERFNDGEIFVEVYENVRGEDMFIIQPTSNPANDNCAVLLPNVLQPLFHILAMPAKIGAPKHAHRSRPNWWQICW